MPYRVLIVDDSAVIRRALKKIFRDEPDFEVVASAANGHLALRALEETTVDAVVLDVEMPVMNGLETLDAIRRLDRTLPVVMFSALTTRGSEATLEALTRGASDYVPKPSQQESAEDSLRSVREALVPRLRSLVETQGLRKHGKPTTIASPTEIPAPRRRDHQEAVDVVAVGVSTGGPNALRTVLSSLPADLGVPVVITQHMPATFTSLLARRLDDCTKLTVREAQDGDALEAGVVHLAPGDRHLCFESTAGGLRVRLDDGPPVNSCRPAVDVMLDSLAAFTAGRTLVAILTGMGRDGLEGSRRLADLGAHVLAQDAATSVVWGMPGFVAREGVADAVLPLEEIGPEILRIVRPKIRTHGHPAAAGSSS